MIKSFKDDDTEKIFKRQYSRALPQDIQQIGLRKFRMRNNSVSIADLRILPANHLEKLVGDWQGKNSIRVTDQWRICFEWHAGNAYQVEIVDPH